MIAEKKERAAHGAAPDCVAGVETSSGSIPPSAAPRQYFIKVTADDIRALAERGAAGCALLYLRLKHYAGRDGRCWPSISTLARELSTSKPRVLRQIAKLIALGLVSKVESDRPRNGSTYMVHEATGNRIGPVTEPDRSQNRTSTGNKSDAPTGNKSDARTCAESAASPDNCGLCNDSSATEVVPPEAEPETTSTKVVAADSATSGEALGDLQSFLTDACGVGPGVGGLQQLVDRFGFDAVLYEADARGAAGKAAFRDAIPVAVMAASIAKRTHTGPTGVYESWKRRKAGGYSWS